MFAIRRINKQSFNTQHFKLIVVITIDRIETANRSFNFFASSSEYHVVTILQKLAADEESRKNQIKKYCAVKIT